LGEFKGLMLLGGFTGISLGDDRILIRDDS
jgi:hypothetical protein